MATPREPAAKIAPPRMAESFHDTQGEIARSTRRPGEAGSASELCRQLRQLLADKDVFAERLAGI